MFLGAGVDVADPVSLPLARAVRPPKLGPREGKQTVRSVAPRQQEFVDLGPQRVCSLVAGAAGSSLKHLDLKVLLGLRSCAKDNSAIHRELQNGQ